MSDRHDAKRVSLTFREADAVQIMHGDTGFLQRVIDDRQSPVPVVLCRVPGKEAFARRSNVGVSYVGNNCCRAIHVVFDDSRSQLVG